jgi:hypothetical protein
MPVILRGEPREADADPSAADAALAEMGMMQVRIATLDVSDAMAAKRRVQVAADIRWMRSPWDR